MNNIESTEAHKHTGFYLVEIGLATVLVLVTVLFFLWVGNLNSQIAVIEQERDTLQSELTLDVEGYPFELSEYYRDNFSVGVNGRSISLYPYKYRFDINGVDFIDIEVPHSGPTTNISFRKTNQDNIIGLRWVGVDLFTHTRDYFIDTESVKVISFDHQFFYELDPKFIVHFSDVSFALQASLSNSSLCSEDSAVKNTDDCNKLYPVSVDALLLDGVPVVAFNAIDLKHDLHAQGEQLIPNVYVSWLGVSPDLDRVYFTFLEETYSINSEGQVEQAVVPDDLVTMTDEVYE